MKNKILLPLFCLIVISIQATEIPSFEHIRNTSSFGCNQKDATFFAFRNHLIENENMPLEDIEPILINWFKENPELYDYANGKVATSDSSYVPEKLDPSAYKALLKQCEEYLSSSPSPIDDFQLGFHSADYWRWKKLKESLENQLHHHTSNVTYADAVSVLIRTSSILSMPANLTESAIRFIHVKNVRCQEVVRVLNNLGIKQTMSDECTDLYAQLMALEIMTNNSTKTIEEENFLRKKGIALLKTLLETYEE